MRLIKFSLLVLVFTIIKPSNSQTPINRIRNYSFESGPGITGYHWIEKDGGQIDYWHEAFPSTTRNWAGKLVGQEDNYTALWLKHSDTNKPHKKRIQDFGGFFGFDRAKMNYGTILLGVKLLYTYEK